MGMGDPRYQGRIQNLEEGEGGPNDLRAFVWENLRCHVHFCETINNGAILIKLGCLFA